MQVLRAGLIAQSCFVCGLDKRTLRHEGPGFLTHVLHEHNAWDYLCFIALCIAEESCEGPGGGRVGATYGWNLETHVRNMIYGGDLSFLPDGEALCTTLHDEQKETRELFERQTARQTMQHIEEGLSRRLDQIEKVRVRDRVCVCVCVHLYVCFMCVYVCVRVCVCRILCL